MKTSFLFIALAAVLVSGCGEKKSSNGSAETNASGNPLTAPVDYLGAVGKAQQTAVKTVDVSSINQAIQLYQVDKGRYPTDLDELVKEKFLPQIPAAPYGQKIVYDPASGQVKVVKQ